MGINWNTLSFFSKKSEGESLWAEADALAVVVGKDDVTYSKSTTLQVSEVPLSLTCA